MDNSILLIACVTRMECTFIKVTKNVQNVKPQALCP